MQRFTEYHPNSTITEASQVILFVFQDKLGKKDFYAAKLYYDLGNYLGNNYESCVITAQNALKDYPYTHLREDLSILILRAKYEMAVNSVETRKMERFRDTVDEYYAFKNEFPDSTFIKEATMIFVASNKVIKE